MGSFIEELKIACCQEHDSKQILFIKAFQNGYRFRDIRGQRFAVLTLKISYYVTYDQEFDIKIDKSNSSASYIYHKLFTGKKIR